MKISCVMSVYNESPFMIHRAVNSILLQSYKISEIIIVVDNPDNKDIIQFLYAEYGNNILIRIIVNKTNKGLAYSLNRGIQEASSEWICRMDADDEALPQRLKASIKLVQEKGIDFVTTSVIVVNEEGETLEKQRRFPCDAKAIKKISRYAPCTIHPTWLFKKEIWESIGGYREAMVAAQDYDFVMRVLKQGFQIEPVREPQLKYTVREKSISGKNTSKQAFLATYAQNNVIRNAEFDANINKKIIIGECKEYEKFKECFDEFWRAKNKIVKVWSILKGSLLSKYCRRYYYNTAMLKLLCKYYMWKE